ncbi:hypothetical protein HDC37_001407 [Microbacterium sp. AK009]|nr:hypothetical protein [Microbacterium sp. AK009]
MAATTAGEKWLWKPPASSSDNGTVIGWSSK